MVETHLANNVLTNGARFYVDHAHPEYSTPECADAIEALIHDRAGEEVLRRSMTAVSSLMPDAPTIVVYKNNSDGKGNSYGATRTTSWTAPSRSPTWWRASCRIL